jgi:hypothetical protein
VSAVSQGVQCRNVHLPSKHIHPRTDRSLTASVCRPFMRSTDMTYSSIGKPITTADHSYSTAQRLERNLKCGMMLAVLASVGACSGNGTITPPNVGVGGEQSVGGTQAAAGGTTPISSSAVGGTQANVGGASNAGGTGGTTAQVSSAGGTVAVGGTVATGGKASTSTGGKASTSTGGKASTSIGGTVAVGGTAATGGTVATGGKVSTSTGGKVSTSTGGKASTSTGGTAAVGGTAATGGAPAGGTTSATGGAGGGTPGTCTSEYCGSTCNATSAGLLSSQYKKLPDPFAMHSGTRIGAKSDWECRRAEIKADIEKYEIGPKPDPSTATVKATLSGTNLSVVVTTTSGSLTIKTAVTGSGSCVRIATDMELSYVTGCTNVKFSTNDVIPYNGGSGSQSQADPFYKVYPSLWGKIGNYTAWSWGVSRLIDGLDQVKDQLKIDMTKIATHGCSYAGKMALFAGAFDERVALTVAEESGGGGICSWRASQDFTTRTGTNVEKIDNTNYAWFMSSMKSLDPYKLPHDHHELIAMVAPRAIIILGNPEYEWLGDESGYKSTMAAVEVFKALGVADHIGYDFTGNHAHCTAATSQQTSISAFADKFLHGKTTTSTNIAIKPNSSKFDMGADFDWTTPTLQ